MTAMKNSVEEIISFGLVGVKAEKNSEPFRT